MNNSRLLAGAQDGQASSNQSAMERVGALADGALDANEAGALLDALAHSEQLRATWDELHLVGDCLRSEEVATSGSSLAFLTRFSATLEREPTLVAPGMLRRGPAFWKRVGMPAAAITAAIAMVAALGPFPLGSRANLQANSGAATSPAGELEASAANLSSRAAIKPVNAAEMREYLAAHQEYSIHATRGPGGLRDAAWNIGQDDAPTH